MYHYNFIDRKDCIQRFEIDGELLSLVHKMIKHSQEDQYISGQALSKDGKCVCALKDPMFYGK